MSTLSNYANASAGGREERIAKIFAKLNTKNDYQPMMLKPLVNVTNETIFGYLKTIQNAQMLTSEYQDHLGIPFESTSYAKPHIRSQIEHAEKQYAEWQKRSKKAQNFNSERKQQLLQFQFQTNPHISSLEFWNRLEHSLLIYSLLAK